MEEDLFGDSFPSLSEDFLHTSNQEASKRRKSGASIMEELGDATMAAMVNNIGPNASSDRKLTSTTMEVVGDVTMAALMCPEASEKPLHSSTPTLDRKSNSVAGSVQKTNVCVGSHISKVSPPTNGSPKGKVKGEGTTSTRKHISREPVNAHKRPVGTLVNPKKMNVKVAPIEADQTKVTLRGKDLVITPSKPISNLDHRKIASAASTKSKRLLDQSDLGRLLDTRKDAIKNPLPTGDHQMKANLDFVSARSLLGKESIQKEKKSDNQEQRVDCVKDFVTARSLVEEAVSGKDSMGDVDLEEAGGEKQTKTVVTDNQLEISAWGLPDTVVEQYKEKGITSMFSWQAECLTTDQGKALQGGNLVYSAPTSAGKTLVAEILMMKRVFETGKKALLILPFVSLAREKMFHLQSLLRDAGIRVEGFMGSSSPAGGLKVTDIAVATIEKANGLVNRMMEEKVLDNLTCVVVDELHMLGDSSRGYLLELLLTKILYSAGPSVQVIGMSATLPNLGDLSRWLCASLYTTNFRPVPLTELLKVGDTLLSTCMKPVGTVSPPLPIPGDPDNLTWLCLQTVLDGHSVLLFCSTKSWVEKLAEAVSTALLKLGRPDPRDSDPVSCDIRSKLQGQLSGTRLEEVLLQLQSSPAGLDATLARVLRVGVAFHHAGLTTEERDIVELAFKSGAVRVLIATTTLSSGVNLPARRVILRCPFTYNGQMMDKLQYRQMVGRAGRKGIDSEGESILLCKPQERAKVASLVSGEVEPVSSCLANSGGATTGAMKRAILEVIVSGAASTKEEVARYASCTLLAAQLEKEEGQEGVIQDCVTFLETSEFIRLQEVDGAVRYVATRLGLACLAASLGPDESLKVFTELSKARKQFVLENELHIIYLIVPIYAAVSWPNLNWMSFLNLWEDLSEDMKRVGTIVGVEERWMVRAMRGTLRLADPEQRRCLGIHQRFYTALALHDLVHEVSLADVAAKYGATKGMLQGLQQAASTFAGMVTVFCQRLGWNNLELLVGQFQDRLEFGVQRELTDLCRLASVDGARARMLFDSGVESVALLAAAKAEDVENVILGNTAFASNKEGLRSSKGVFITGRPAMTVEQCSKLMVSEARALLQRDLGLRPQAWDSQPTAKRATPPSARPRKRRRSSEKMTEPAAPSPHLAFQLQTPVQNLTVALQRKAVSPTAELTVANPLKTKPPTPPTHETNPGAGRAILDKVGQLSSAAQPKRPVLKEVELTKGNGEDQLETGQSDDVEVSKTLKGALGEGKLKKKELPGKENVAASNQGLSLAKETACEVVAVEKSNDSISRQDLSQKLSKVSNNSLVNTSFDMSSVVENIFEESMVLDGDEDCCPTGPPPIRKRVSWGDAKEEGGLVVSIPLKEEEVRPASQPIMFDTTDEDGWTSNTEAMESPAKDCAILATPKLSSMPATPRIAICSEELSLHWSDSGGEGDEDAGGADDAFTGGENITSETLDHQNINLEVNMVTMETMSASLLDHAMEEEVVVQHSVNPLPVKAEEINLEAADESGSRLEVPLKNAARAQLQRRGRRRKAAGVRKGSKRRRSSSKSPGVILSDSEGDSDQDSHLRQREVNCSKKQALSEASVEERMEEQDEVVPEQPSQSPSQLSELCVIDVTCSRQLLDSFVREWRGRKSFSLAVAVERSSDASCPVLDVGVGRVVGIAVSWSAFDVFYLGLADSQYPVVDDTLCPATQDRDIKLEELLDLIGEMVESTACITAMTWRQQMGLIYSVTGRFPGGSARDPAVAGWLLDPGSSPATLARLVVDHCPTLLSLLPTLGSGPGTGSLALNPASKQPARQRAAAEAVLVRHLMHALEQALDQANLIQHFTQVEMGSEIVLGWMELTGMGVNEAEFEDCRLLLQARLKIIEEKSFREAGRHFTFSSPQDICKLLFHELRLPVNGDPKLTLKMVRPGKQGLKLSAAKEVLERLVARGHSLPGLVLEHRRITAALNTTVTPLLQGASLHPELGGARLYPTAVTHTATGRVSLHEPNLQNVPRDFQVALTEELKAVALGKRAGRRSKRRNSSSLALSPLERLLGPPDTSAATVSLRHAIVPAEGNLFLSADYKQIELRVLAHLSKDPTLCTALRTQEDVFKSIAGQLNNCPVDKVSEDQRRDAKQIVYGILYGMGDRALASQLGVEQEDAGRFMETFKSRYPVLRTFLHKCVAQARASCCVETMSGRKRKLPDIAHASQHRRAAAERVAVNTKVQGSAADLVKAAMVKVEQGLRSAWPQRRPLKWCRGRQQWSSSGASLALQLHDELIYEVAGDDIVQVAQIVREAMEGAMLLDVPTPVRLMVGASWGSLREFKL